MNNKNSINSKKKHKRWSKKYKKSINCRKPKGFSQRQYCKFTRKKQKGGLALHASQKIWVCRGNIGCAKNINIY